MVETVSELAEERPVRPTRDGAEGDRPVGRRRRRLAAVLSAAVRVPPGLVLAVAMVAWALGWAFFPELFTSSSPVESEASRRLLPPSSEHLFGTDQLGRDVYARVVFGASVSLRAAVLAVGIGLVVGTLVGVVSGSAGGWVDSMLMRFVDVLLAVPGLLMAMAIITILGFGTVKVAIAVGVAAVAGFARLARAEAVRVRSAPYVEAARVSGVRWRSILFRHILRGSAGPVLALAAIEFGSAILSVSALSFLGYGAPPPTPEWGAMVSDGRDYIAVAWWLTVLPGAVIAVVVLATNRISRAVDTKVGGHR